MDTNVETTDADIKRVSENVPSSGEQQAVITATAEILQFGTIMANAKRLRGTDLSGLSDAELLSALTS